MLEVTRERSTLPNNVEPHYNFFHDRRLRSQKDRIGAYQATVDLRWSCLEVDDVPYHELTV